MPTIKKNITTVNRFLDQNDPEWIVVHNVGTAPQGEGAAYNNTVYFKSVNRQASAHYFIDDGDVIWQSVELKDGAWSVGDSWSRNGANNRNSINIEVCGNWQFSDKEIENLRWLVQRLMAEYGIPASRVCRHYDVTTKQCPAYYVDQARWNELHAYVTGSASKPSGGSSAGSTGSTKGPVGAALLLDCDAGIKTWSEWARQLGLSGSDADGYINYQYTGNKKYLRNVSSAIYAWYKGCPGSPTVKAVQRRIGSKNVDGVWGAVDTENLKAYMREQRGYKMTTDGPRGLRRQHGVQRAALLEPGLLAPVGPRPSGDRRPLLASGRGGAFLLDISFCNDLHLL